MENEIVSPKTRKKDKMQKIELYLPTPLLEQAEMMALQDGINPSEFHRLLWQQGFSLYCESSNKRLVNRKMRRDLGIPEPQEE